MKSRRFGFLRHYKRIKVEGINISAIINKCIRNGIPLRNLRWKNPLESTMEVQGEDFSSLKKLAGHSYGMTVLKEGGTIPAFRSMKANVVTVIGAFFIGALIFYQSLFVAEIRIDGYQSIDETAVRQTLAEAGLYEGARKQDNYDQVKAALYETYDKITWVSIFEQGRLIKVNIAEAGTLSEEEEDDSMPVNIVAERSGMIEKVIPLRGEARVRKGDYVNQGDVLISGKYKYQSTDYSKGDDFFTLYSHAEGQAFAKVPRQLTYYLEKNQREKEPTGRFIPGIYIKCGDLEIDTANGLCGYEVSVRKETTLLHLVKPIPITLSFVRVEEVRLRESPRNPDELKDVMAAALRQYAKENLQSGEEILDSSIDYTERENTIQASVLLEVLEEIGVEKKIDMEKEKKKEKENEQEKTAQ